MQLFHVIYHAFLRVPVSDGYVSAWVCVGGVIYNYRYSHLGKWRRVFNLYWFPCAGLLCCSIWRDQKKPTGSIRMCTLKWEHYLKMILSVRTFERRDFFCELRYTLECRFILHSRAKRMIKKKKKTFYNGFKSGIYGFTLLVKGLE